MSVLEFTPVFSEDKASGFVKEFFGLEGTLSPLPSERDQNFRLIATNGESYVLKIANAREDRSMLEAQNQAMRYLAQQISLCPRVIPAKEGSCMVEVQSNDTGTHLLRLVSYLQGTPMGLLKRRSRSLFQNLGTCIAQVDKALTAFDHPATRYDFHWDLAQALRVVNQYQQEVSDPEIRTLIKRCSADFERIPASQLNGLRQSVIHNDANDYNVLVGGGSDLYTRNQYVTGIIDFGDMVYSYTVADLAIAIAYAILGTAEPLQTAVEIVRGYHGENPLNENEISVLFNLIRMRLCVSACMAAHQQKQRPDDKYLSLSQQPIRKILPILVSIAPEFAEALFRSACGMNMLPENKKMADWLSRNGHLCHPVMGKPLTADSCKVLDLGVDSPLVSGDPTVPAGESLRGEIATCLEQAGVEYGIGQYREPRLPQTSFLIDSTAPREGISRTMHLCMEVVASPGVPVFAPLRGRINSLNKPEETAGQAATVVLEHRPETGTVFYTRFSSLSPSSLAPLALGQIIEQGEPFAAVASTEENGGWPPHLSIQLLTNLFAEDIEVPAVCFPDQVNAWSQFSPDPNLILQIPQSCFPPPRPSKTETLAARRKHISDNLSIGYRDPIKVVRGWQQYLYDDNGRQFLDAYNNVPHVGHCHPEVIQAGLQQMKCLNTNTRYLHDTINRYAEKLSATMPEPLEVCFFLNSASEANELAIRLAKAHTGQKDFIVLEGAYHGNTNTLIDISPYKHSGPGGEGAPDWVHTAPVADVYRGPYKGDDPEAGKKYAQHVQQIISNLATAGTGLAGYIAESYPSVGGQIIFPPEYLSTVYDHVRAAGGICIADEVQTGYGRIGTHFYSFQAQNAVPDIVILGKPIGNGHPIGALVTTREIAQSFITGMEFFSTFGGNTVSCAIGLKVLELTLKENLQDNALQVGSHLLQRLRPLKDRFRIVGDVRGSGLFLGVELVRDRETLEPAADEASFIANRMRDKGILMSTDGPFHNVVKIRPPLVITTQDADRIADAMEEILAEDFA